MSQGVLFVVSAPSGAGKTSLLQALVDTDPKLKVSVSHTTRPIRPGEREGVHYHFVEEATFAQMIGASAFLEYARVFGNFYGTSAAAVRGQLETGEDVILEIDWQGARQVRELFPEAVSLFILPPTPAALRERLTNRGQDSEAVIDQRMRQAVSEMSHYPEFDYLIVNDDFDQALRELSCVVVAQRSRREIQAARRATQLQALLAG